MKDPLFRHVRAYDQEQDGEGELFFAFNAKPFQQETHPSGQVFLIDVREQFQGYTVGTTYRVIKKIEGQVVRLIFWPMGKEKIVLAKLLPSTGWWMVFPDPRADILLSGSTNHSLEMLAQEIHTLETTVVSAT